MEVSSTDKKAPTGVEQESVKKVEDPVQKSGVVHEVDNDQKKSNKAQEKEGGTGERVEDPSLQGLPTATNVADILPFRRSVFETDSSLE